LDFTGGGEGVDSSSSIVKGLPFSLNGFAAAAAGAAPGLEVLEALEATEPTGEGSPTVDLRLAPPKEKDFIRPPLPGVEFSEPEPGGGGLTTAEAGEIGSLESFLKSDGTAFPVKIAPTFPKALLSGLTG
jgi:hypothetical protein